MDYIADDVRRRRNFNAKVPRGKAAKGWGQALVGALALPRRATVPVAAVTRVR